MDDEECGEELALFFLVVGATMVLCPVVAVVGRAGAPKISELFLFVAVVQPQKSYVHGFGGAGQNVVGYDTKGSAVVGLDWGGGLRVAQFLEEGLAGDGFLCVDVKRAKFSFCCQGHDGFDDLGDVEDGTIVGSFVGAIGKEQLSAGADSCFWFTEIRCVTVDAKDHVALDI